MAIDPKITAAEVASYLELTVQAVHKRIKSNGLKERKSQNRVYFGHETSRSIIGSKTKQLKISTAVVKGGVGKTTLAEALAIRVALYGEKVLCIDLDQQANLTKGLGMDDQAKVSPVMIDLVENKAKAEDAVLNVVPGLDLVPSRLDNVTLDGYMMVNRINPSRIIHKIFNEVFKKYDLIIFDCPPTLGSTVCAAMLASDLVIAPLNPDIYSYEGIEIMSKEMKNINEMFDKNINWKILLNKFDSRTILSTDYISQLIKDPYLSTILLKSVVRTSQNFPNMKSKGKTIFDSLKKSTAKEDIDALAREILCMMQSESSSRSPDFKPQESEGVVETA